MSKRLPQTSARAKPENLAILLREPFLALSDDLLKRLAERGHHHVRYPHGNVFQYLDDAGTRVSVLAERAQMTKQSMAELVAHLERHGYVERVPIPATAAQSSCGRRRAATKSSGSRARRWPRSKRAGRSAWESSECAGSGPCSNS